MGPGIHIAIFAAGAAVGIVAHFAGAVPGDGVKPVVRRANINAQISANNVSNVYVPEVLLVRERSAEQWIRYLIDEPVLEGEWDKRDFLLRLHIEAIPDAMLKEVFLAFDEGMKLEPVLKWERKSVLYSYLIRRLYAVDSDFVKEWSQSDWVRKSGELSRSLVKALVKLDPKYAVEFMLNDEFKVYVQGWVRDELLLNLGNEGEYSQMVALTLESGKYIDYTYIGKHLQLGLHMDLLERMKEQFFSSKVSRDDDLWHRRDVFLRDFYKGWSEVDQEEALRWFFGKEMETQKLFASKAMELVIKKPSEQYVFSDEVLEAGRLALNEEDWNKIMIKYGGDPSSAKKALRFKAGRKKMLVDDVHGYVIRHPSTLFSTSEVIANEEERFLLIKSVFKEARIYHSMKDHRQLVDESGFREEFKQELYKIVENPPEVRNNELLDK